MILVVRDELLPRLQRRLSDLGSLTLALTQSDRDKALARLTELVGGSHLIEAAPAGPG